MKRKQMKYYPVLLLFCLTLLVSCYDDKGEYDYRPVNSVTFLTMLEGFSFLAGQEVEVAPPVTLGEDVPDLGEAFEIRWYIDGEYVMTGPVFRHTFAIPGNHSLQIKITDTKGGEVYISDPYKVAVVSTLNWGWLVLSDMEGRSALSVITPEFDTSMDFYKDLYGEELGTEPHSLHYYVLDGSIPSVYVSGLAKVLVNQGSGSVTLEGAQLKKDYWLKDEFSNGTEPEGLLVKGFVNKDTYFTIQDQAGDLYLRFVDKAGGEHFGIPYYGRYSSTPYVFRSGSRITYSAAFENEKSYARVTGLYYDELNGRFLGLSANASGTLTQPRPIYFGVYSDALEANFPAGVKRVDQMGTGTKVVAVTAAMNYKVIGDNWVNFVRYISLIHDGGGYFMHEWEVMENTYSDTGTELNHQISDTRQYEFSGGILLRENSVVLLSANPAKSNYSYFTDGEGTLYVHDYASNTHKQLGVFDTRVDRLCASPIANRFYNYGGNPVWANYRLAVSQEGGKITILDVSPIKIQALFAGLATGESLVLSEKEGFGDVKDMVWMTRGFFEEY